jgi:hypothetical protein
MGEFGLKEAWRISTDIWTQILGLLADTEHRKEAYNLTGLKDKLQEA